MKPTELKATDSYGEPLNGLMNDAEGEEKSQEIKEEDLDQK